MTGYIGQHSMALVLGNIADVIASLERHSNARRKLQESFDILLQAAIHPVEVERAEVGP